MKKRLLTGGLTFSLAFIILQTFFYFYEQITHPLATPLFSVGATIYIFLPFALVLFGCGLFVSLILEFIFKKRVNIMSNRNYVLTLIVVFIPLWLLLMYLF